MRVATGEADTERRGRRRALAILIVLLVHALLLSGFLLLNTRNQLPGEKRMMVFSLLAPKPEATKAKLPSAPKKTSGARPKVTPVPKPDVKPPTKLFTTELMPAFDITKVPSHPAEQSGQGTGDTGEGKDSVAVYGPGGGPHGEPLYKAEWYVEPTHAELAYYQPKVVPPGSWAIIACKTVEKFHVEDCQELDESPRGYGLARALRLASWQFRVRPPRVGGKHLIGSWVSIRIDWTDPPKDQDGPSGP